MIEVIVLIGVLVLAGIGWYKYAYKAGVDDAVSSVNKQMEEDIKEMIDEVGRIDAEYKDETDEDVRRRRNNNWT